MLVSAEQAQDGRFHSFLRQSHQRIGTVVFDEAPLFSSSPFRKNLALVPVIIRSLTSSKFVLLSATVPVSSENQLLEAFGIPNAAKVRACTVNWNLVHHVHNVRERRIGPAEVKGHLLSSKDCAVVFVKSVAECEQLARQLNSIPELQSRVVFYHAKLDQRARSAAHEAWKTGKKQVMVATTAFAFGVDSANCDLVIHVDGAFDLETYCQGAGRAGRNGQAAKSIMLLSRSAFRCEDAKIADYMKNTSKCRRVLLSQMLDSQELVSEANCGSCDNCCRLKLQKQQRNPRLVDMVDIEQATRSPTEERNAASKRIALSKKKASLLNRRLEMSMRQHSCFVCSILGKTTGLKHGLTQCPSFRNRCFRCGDTHRRSDCAVHKLWNDACSSNAVCVTCCTPCDSIVKSFHLGEGTVGSRCRYRDTIVPACWALWRHHQKEVLEFMYGVTGARSTTACQYARWLCRVSDGLSNATLLIAHFMKATGR